MKLFLDEYMAYILTAAISYGAGLFTWIIFTSMFKEVNDKNSIESFNEYNEN